MYKERDRCLKIQTLKLFWIKFGKIFLDFSKIGLSLRPYYLKFRTESSIQKIFTKNQINFASIQTFTKFKANQFKVITISSMFFYCE